MREIQFVTGEYYHVYNRGVTKQPIFFDISDYIRFTESMCLFNDSTWSHPGGRIRRKLNLLARLEEMGKFRQPFVSIVSFCLMPNHFHMLLKQEQDEGMKKFMHKLGMGFANYFNLRHKRSGVLFESAFKAVHIENDSQLWHVPRYIHLNALDLSHSGWREGSVSKDDWPLLEQTLDAYPWSSHHVYTGRKQELPIIELSLVAQLFRSPDEYRKCLQDWSGRFVTPF